MATLVITRWYLGVYQRGEVGENQLKNAIIVLWRNVIMAHLFHIRHSEVHVKHWQFKNTIFQVTFLGVISPWLLAMVIQISYTILFTTLIASCKHKNYVDLAGRGI